jgi:hypothetical protein
VHDSTESNRKEVKVMQEWTQEQMDEFDREYEAHLQAERQHRADRLGEPLQSELGSRVAVAVIDEEDAACDRWHEKELARGELAFCADTAECYECRGFDGVHCETRKIVALGHVVEAHRDPTQSYVLECGHTVI